MQKESKKILSMPRFEPGSLDRTTSALTNYISPPKFTGQLRIGLTVIFKFWAVARLGNESKLHTLTKRFDFFS